ncbi:alpha-galactosidase [Pedobacter sp. LMG 31464]|uniref:Alpha-galactosidase n=1 Tax=Pedobacter planticolens TaxID=2679964 RepID=A0A923DXZ2_9SPHI|nr:alpha-galactosidase [Pedobacter planticolens]MBB2145121.1 alpha-galactosidase [Pedobacter planticolens]
MNPRIILLTLSLFCSSVLWAQNRNPIVIETQNTSLVFAGDEGGKLYQRYFGKTLSKDAYAKLRNGMEAYIGAGMEDVFEPAIRIVHADGNPSLDLRFIKVETKKLDGDITQTDIYLKDPVYQTEVILHFKAAFKSNVLSSSTEIINKEKNSVVLSNYASSMLHFDASNYFLTQFHGDWAREMDMQESQLTSGIKIIDSKLGSRANMYQSPVFFLAPNKIATETEGEVIAGTIAWTGNFQFVFEVDRTNKLRVISGINPYASTLTLKAGEHFMTPEFIFTYSANGKGEASRNLHTWARVYGVLDGLKPRMTLLNNWEATHVKFDQEKLVELFDGSKKLGLDLFLLDDGWFGNKYPRNDDKAGLGDWQEDRKKLPDGIGYLVKEATKKGIKFGIWLEPEMVNPKSELYEKHPDWVLKLPNRAENYQRNQLILDLINPKVQDFVFNLIDKMMTENPGLAYIKWDNNRFMSNTYSPYLGKDQSRLFIDYTESFYKVMQRIRAKYPHLGIMLCSGGGGRTDYGALKYFDSFWPSDNTDAAERVFIQWGYSYFFPSNTISSHVTSMGKQTLKFRTDVAMMDKLGYDISVDKMTPEEISFSSAAIANYNRLNPIIWYGDLYRLVSPYDEDRAVLMYTDSTKNKAVLFSYNLNLRKKEIFGKVKLQGLNPDKEYTITETNLIPGAAAESPENGKVYTGSYLMNIGLNVSPAKLRPLSSIVLEITSK